MANSPLEPTFYKRGVFMDCNFTTNKILFDYFSFTIKTENTTLEPEDVISMLGFDNVNFIETYGSKGFKHRYYYDGVSIHFGGRELIWVEMSGQGCRVYESYGLGDWFSLAYQVLSDDNAHMTRLDIAYDDFNGLLDLPAILADVQFGNWVSRCDKIICESSYRQSGCDGICITAGQRGSNISCRIYDKAAERGRANEIDHWVRCELQLRHKHCDNFLYYLLSDEPVFNGIKIDDNKRLDCLYFAVLNHFLRFIDKDSNNDSNVWRKPLSKHWQKFISNYYGLSVSLYKCPGVDYNISRLVHNTIDMYGGMIYTYIQIFGIDQLEKEVDFKRFKLNIKYQSLIESARLEGVNKNGS